MDTDGVDLHVGWLLHITGRPNRAADGRWADGAGSAGRPLSGPVTSIDAPVMARIPAAAL